MSVENGVDCGGGGGVGGGGVGVVGLLLCPRLSVDLSDAAEHGRTATKRTKLKNSFGSGNNAEALHHPVTSLYSATCESWRLSFA